MMLPARRKIDGPSRYLPASKLRYPVATSGRSKLSRLLLGDFKTVLSSASPKPSFGDLANASNRPKSRISERGPVTSRGASAVARILGNEPAFLSEMLFLY